MIIGAILGGILSFFVALGFDASNRRKQSADDARMRLFLYRSAMVQLFDNYTAGWEYEFELTGSGTHLRLTNRTGDTVTGLSIAPACYVPVPTPRSGDAAAFQKWIEGTARRYHKQLELEKKWSGCIVITEVDSVGQHYVQEADLSPEGVPQHHLRDQDTAIVVLEDLVDEVDYIEIRYFPPSNKGVIVRSDDRLIKRIPVPPHISMADFYPGMA